MPGPAATRLSPTRSGRHWAGAVALLIALLPSLASWAVGQRGTTIFQGPAAAELRDRSPLALHIHMVHLREFDIRNGRAVARFGFHNAGEQPLRIRQIKPSCGCVTTRMQQPDRGFAPGESGVFYLEVDTAAESSGDHEYDVKIEFFEPDGELQTSHVLFRITVPEKSVTVRPRALIYYQLGQEPTSQTVTITDFRRGYDFEILNAVAEGEFLSVDAPERSTDAQGQTVWTFEATAAGAVPSGQHTGNVLIETNDAEFPELRLPVLIYGPPASAEAND